MEKKYVVGVDVGGQSCKIGVVDAEGNILVQGVMSSIGFAKGEEFVSSLATVISELIDKSGKKGQILGIGVGAPNGNYYTGTIAFAPNLPWAANGSVDFSRMLAEKLDGIPVALTNDANAAAMGEMTYGVAKGLRHFIMITLGTGVGSGIVVNGEVLYGSDGFAGELGHTCVVRHNGRLCGCGKAGCLETYCSAIGVARTAREWLDSSEEPSLLRGKEDISSKDVYEAALKGDRLAKRVFDFTGRILGAQLADFIAFSAPQAIVLFGGLARAKEFIYEPIMEAMNANTLKIWKNKVKVLFSSLKESDAAILGASALAWKFK